MTQPAAESLSATISQYFIGGMMPESANPVQQSVPVIEIRPSRGDWQCCEDLTRHKISDRARERASPHTGRTNYTKESLTFWTAAVRASICFCCCAAVACC